jgi:dTDP-4-amino-4,6-dideoxygalactose transaminase
MLNTPFSQWPSYSEDELAAVMATLRSGCVNYWTGQECRHFEREMAAWSTAKHGVALANGTVALELALKVLGVGPGDEVVVTPRTFLASVSSIVNAGARPVFADVDCDSQNITLDTIVPMLSPHTRAIMCVHLAGWPCAMDEIGDLANKLGLFLIEDCAQAVGAKYRGQPVGSFSQVAAWSFCQDKIITTGGEGGMLTTSDPTLWSKAWSYKDHGKSWNAVNNAERGAGFQWLHESFGTNWRMTEMQAAIGRIQLRKLPQWQAARRRNAEEILKAAQTCGVFRVPTLPQYVEHAWYKAYIFVESKSLRSGWTRDRVVAEINSRVPCTMGSCPEVYLEKAFDKTEFRPTKHLPVARELGQSSVMFMVHPTLTDHEIDRTCQVIREVGALAYRAAGAKEVRGRSVS